jgi:hypothetical protein
MITATRLKMPKILPQPTRVIFEARVLVTSEAGGSGLAVELGYAGWIMIGGYTRAVDVLSEDVLSEDVLSEDLLTFVGVPLVEEIGVMLSDDVE